MLYILGSELYSCGKAGEGTGLPFFYRRSYIPLRVPDHISGIPHHQHKTGDRGERFLGLYSIDAADNLFPSIHCLVSWFCFLGIKDQKRIPAWYKGVSFVLAVLVFLSTLFTKQHVLVDVAGGVILAQICFMLGQKTEIWHIYERVGSKIEKKINRYIEGAKR